MDYLVTAIAERDSYMYHVPAVEVAELAAKAIGVSHVEFRVLPEDELIPLKETLSKLKIDGVCIGAVASEYQRSRVQRICDELNLELLAPLWHVEPKLLMRQLMEQKFELLLVGVAAMGLDERWLGQILDLSNLESFLAVCRKNRIHPAGEGGEFETLVLSGPHMEGRIEVEFNKLWFGDCGELEIIRSHLAK